MSAAEAWDMVADRRTANGKQHVRKRRTWFDGAVELAAMFGVGSRYVQQARFILLNDALIAAADRRQFGGSLARVAGRAGRL